MGNGEKDGYVASQVPAEGNEIIDENKKFENGVYVWRSLSRREDIEM